MYIIQNNKFIKHSFTVNIKYSINIKLNSSIAKIIKEKRINDVFKNLFLNNKPRIYFWE